MKKINRTLVIWGASGHAKVVVDIIQLHGHFQIIGLLDDINSGRHGETFFGYPVLGGKEQLDELVKLGTEHMIMGFGNWHYSRYRLGKFAYSKGFKFIDAVHPRSIIARDALIGEGSVVVAGAVVNPGSKLGKHVIISVHPETVDFRMLGDFGTQTIGSDAHQKRIPGIPSTSIMRN